MFNSFEARESSAPLNNISDEGRRATGPFLPVEYLDHLGETSVEFHNEISGIASVSVRFL